MEDQDICLINHTDLNDNLLENNDQESLDKQNENIICLINQTGMDTVQAQELLNKHNNDVLLCVYDFFNIKKIEKEVNENNKKFNELRAILDEKDKIFEVKKVLFQPPPNF